MQAMAGAILVLAATMGGGYWSGVGPGRIALPRSGVKPIEVLANLRFDFAGAPSDTEGSATIAAYDSMGQVKIGEFPCAWTTGNGAAFRFDLVNDDFAGFLEDRIEAATGGTAVVTLDVAKGRGAIVRQGGELRAAITVTGEATLDGGPPVRLRAKLRVR